MYGSCYLVSSVMYLLNEVPSSLHTSYDVELRLHHSIAAVAFPPSLRHPLHHSTTIMDIVRFTSSGGLILERDGRSYRVRKGILVYLLHTYCLFILHR